eukprot:CAMPEP_0170066582 /NCGR_PEP_ID=MMETSP0019_2-20121128/6229_1 /TAXON_ID=98059 /ORGANISM="Dinobryon sp., Strain UTEXLB2267" /LENGTH=343 /DNA_ID=CAMNT_0010273715 /DNA_START=905 /DNA_END=1936 /DNA_ORIENTATION=-
MVSAEAVLKYYSQLMACMGENQLSDYNEALKSCLTESETFIHISGNRYYQLRPKFPYVYVDEYLQYFPKPLYSGVNGMDWADWAIIALIVCSALSGVVASLWKMQLCAWFSCCCRSNHSIGSSSGSSNSSWFCCERGDYSMPILNFSMRPPFVSPRWGRNHNTNNNNYGNSSSYSIRDGDEQRIGESRLAGTGGFKYKESPRCPPSLDAPQVGNGFSMSQLRRRLLGVLEQALSPGTYTLATSSKDFERPENEREMKDMEEGEVDEEESLTETDALLTTPPSQLQRNMSNRSSSSGSSQKKNTISNCANGGIYSHTTPPNSSLMNSFDREDHARNEHYHPTSL